MGIFPHNLISSHDKHFHNLLFLPNWLSLPHSVTVESTSNFPDEYSNLSSFPSANLSDCTLDKHLDTTPHFLCAQFLISHLSFPQVDDTI